MKYYLSRRESRRQVRRNVVTIVAFFAGLCLFGFGLYGVTTIRLDSMVGLIVVSSGALLSFFAALALYRFQQFLRVAKLTDSGVVELVGMPSVVREEIENYRRMVGDEFRLIDRSKVSGDVRRLREPFPVSPSW